tara:strand:+ start:1211 stop:1603 length:393 start_codon:yes stop_codon:yes gene_type:complete
MSNTNKVTKRGLAAQLHEASTTISDHPTSSSDGIDCTGANYVMVTLEERSGGGTVDARAWAYSSFSDSWAIITLPEFSGSTVGRVASGTTERTWVFCPGADRFDIELQARSSGSLSSWVEPVYSSGSSGG